MSVKSFGSFSAGVFGGVSAPADPTRAPKPSRRPLAACSTSPLLAVQAAGSVRQRCAAAWISMARAAAPATRNGFQNARMELELPVTWMPKVGLP